MRRLGLVRVGAFGLSLPTPGAGRAPAAAVAQASPVALLLSTYSLRASKSALTPPDAVFLIYPSSVLESRPPPRPAGPARN